MLQLGYAMSWSNCSMYDPTLVLGKGMHKVFIYVQIMLQK